MLTHSCCSCREELAQRIVSLTRSHEVWKNPCYSRGGILGMDQDNSSLMSWCAWPPHGPAYVEALRLWTFLLTSKHSLSKQEDKREIVQVNRTLGLNYTSILQVLSPLTLKKLYILKIYKTPLICFLYCALLFFLLYS